MDAMKLILDERKRQDEKWGRNAENDPLWNSTDSSKFTVLGEEVGEVAHAILENDKLNLREELTQVAAVCVCWLQSDFKTPI